MRMRSKVKKNILQVVAEQYHVPEREVCCEIELTIREAMQSPSPEARKFWSQFSGIPTPEEVIICLVKEVNKKLQTQ